LSNGGRLTERIDLFLTRFHNVVVLCSIYLVETLTFGKTL